MSTRPSLMRGRNQITFFQGMIRTPEGAAPDFKNKDFNLTVCACVCMCMCVCHFNHTQAHKHTQCAYVLTDPL